MSQDRLARTNLELDTVGGRPVGHIETFVVESLDLTGERRNGGGPGDIAVRESEEELSRVVTPGEGDLCAVCVRGRSDAELLRSCVEL